MNKNIKFWLLLLVVLLIYGTIILAATHVLHQTAIVVVLSLNSLGSCLGIAAFIRWLRS